MTGWWQRESSVAFQGIVSLPAACNVQSAHSWEARPGHLPSLLIVTLLCVPLVCVPRGGVEILSNRVLKYGLHILQV